MGVGACSCGREVCSLLRKTIYICIVCMLGFQWWCFVGFAKSLSNKLAKHLNVSYLTYTGGEATPRTASWPNTSNSSATLKRGNKEQEEKSSQSELHLWNSATPSSDQLVGRLLVMRPGAFLAGVKFMVLISAFPCLVRTHLYTIRII